MSKIFAFDKPMLLLKQKVCLPLPGYDSFANVLVDACICMYIVLKFSPRLDFKAVQNGQIKTKYVLFYV